MEMIFRYQNDSNRQKSKEPTLTHSRLFFFLGWGIELRMTHVLYEIIKTVHFMFLFIGVLASDEHITEHLTNADTETLQPEGSVSHVQKRSSGNANQLSREVTSNSVNYFYELIF